MRDFFLMNLPIILPQTKNMKKQNLQIFVTDAFTTFITSSASGRRLTPSGKRIAKGTITTYKYVHKLILAFETEQSIRLRIQLLHRASTRMLQREMNYWKRFFTQFSQFLYSKLKYSDNYIASTFKILRTFFNYLEKEKGFVIGNYHKLFKIPLIQPTPVVLTPEQLNFLITNNDFEKKLTPSLKRVKDIFVFGCTVALRYSDLMQLKRTNVVQTEKGWFLRLFTQKTGTEIRVPLPEYAVTIINKYKKATGAFLLPRLSSTNINKGVKKLIKVAEWTYALPKNRSIRGKITEEKNQEGQTWLFYQHITAHTMRRTAITTLLILGVPENVVRKISGHAPGSKEFYKYVSIAQEYLNNEVTNAHYKLLNEVNMAA
jgi:integrase